MTTKAQWLKDLAWFVKTYMNSTTQFRYAFGEQFTPKNVEEFDKLTDELFGKKGLRR